MSFPCCLHASYPQSWALIDLLKLRDQSLILFPKKQFSICFLIIFLSYTRARFQNAMLFFFNILKTPSIWISSFILSSFYFSFKRRMAMNRQKQEDTSYYSRQFFPLHNLLYVERPRTQSKNTYPQSFSKQSVALFKIGFSTLCCK